MSSPYDLGYADGLKGRKKSNPYKVYSAEYDLYEEGYADGKEEREFA